MPQHIKHLTYNPASSELECTLKVRPLDEERQFSGLCGEMPTSGALSAGQTASLQIAEGRVNRGLEAESLLLKHIS